MCDLKMYNRIRPGHITKRIKNIDLETFNIDKELDMMKLEIKSPWNGTMTEKTLALPMRNQTEMSSIPLVPSHLIRKGT